MVVHSTGATMVVDDDPLVLDTLERLLKTGGYTVVTASNGHEALARASSQEFEVVLLDIGMPGLSGIDVLRQLHTDYPDTSVIMVTAVTDTNTAVEAMKLGAYDYVLKPFNLDDIIVRVKKARERRHLALQVKNYQRDLEERLLEREKELRAMTIQLVQSVLKEESLTPDVGAEKRGRKEPPSGTSVRDLGAKIMRRLRSAGY